MATPEKPTHSRHPGQAGDFRLEGQVRLEGAQDVPDDLALMAYAFDRSGALLGTDDVDQGGSFSIPLKLAQPADVQLYVAPRSEPQAVRRSAAFSRSFSRKDWAADGGTARLRAALTLPQAVWSVWRPRWFCVTGHVRKAPGGDHPACPVPYVKVEIFDVDRENCLWPIILRQWPDIVGRNVVRIPELLREKLIPRKPPIPDPIGPVSEMGFGPVPALPQFSFSRAEEPPAEQFRSMAGAGELSPALQVPTLTSVTAPWHLLPHCFHSRRKVCETTTDCDGFFRCCFLWSPFHFRFGRLRFDPRPDIIVRVTQVINGVETVVYMDPYSGTRWNVSGHTHLDLYLDDDRVQCGTGCGGEQADGAAVFFTRIGNDEVYRIDQGSGLYAEGALSNMAYGSQLHVHAMIGDGLTTGAPKRYFRLSRKRGGGAFQPMSSPLSDTRVLKGSYDNEVYSLGPVTVNGQQNLYELRDTAQYHWYNRDLVGVWSTAADEPDEGLYTLRLEIFDENGAKMNSGAVDYRDGTVPPPGPLPPMQDRCDLVVRIDNKAPVVSLSVPQAGGECGVVPFAQAGSLTIQASASQENGRLRSWALSYVKGQTGGGGTLGGGSSPSGLPGGSVSVSVPGTPLTTGLTGTCAFALTLSAWAHVRNGYSASIYHASTTKAIAVEKCPGS